MSSGASYGRSNQWGAAYARLVWIEPSCGVEIWGGLRRDGGGGVGWGGEAWGAGQVSEGRRRLALGSPSLLLRTSCETPANLLRTACSCSVRGRVVPCPACGGRGRRGAGMAQREDPRARRRRGGGGPGAADRFRSPPPGHVRYGQRLGAGRRTAHNARRLAQSRVGHGALRSSRSDDGRHVPCGGSC